MSEGVTEQDVPVELLALWLQNEFVPTKLWSAIDVNFADCTGAELRRERIALSVLTPLVASLSLMSQLKRSVSKALRWSRASTFQRLQYTLVHRVEEVNAEVDGRMTEIQQM
jgi:hypothetical protein